MARPRKNKVEDAAKLADELIAAQAKLKDEGNEPALEDEGTSPVDDLDGLPPDDLDESDDEWDLSRLDEGSPPAPDDKNLTHKLSVLQGKYNAETERLSTLLSQTMTEVQTLKAQLARRTEQPTGDDLPDENVAIDSLKEQYPTLYKSFLALARAEVAKAVKGTSEKVDQIVQQGADDRRSVYYTRLAEKVPHWDKINNHPAFLKWLDEMDEFSGATRKVLLGAAYNRTDYNTTAKIFNAFLKEKGIRVRGKQSEDAENIAPDTSGGGTNRNLRSTEGFVARAEIDKFYQDKAHGRLTGTEAEIAKKEARFFQAVREGKVR